MSNERDPYERLLSALADDLPQDWEAANREALPQDAARMRALRELSGIAVFHRDLQRSAPAADTPRGQWGGLVLLERLADGVRSEVWRAWDPTLHREVALKFMRTDALASGASEAALIDEARAAARVPHPHVVAVHGVARHDDHVGMWMEFVRGPSLATHVRDGSPLSPREAVALAADLASALAALHGAGVLHRDVKPSNVLRAADGRWILADFGLGLSRDLRSSPAHASAGTPMYLSPEAFRGEAPSAASDQYALALTLWFALTGRDAFDARTVEERATQAARAKSPSLRAALPLAGTGLAAIVERALSSDPAARFPSAAAFESALRGWLSTGERKRAPVLAWAALLAFVALAAVTVFAMRRGAPAVAPSSPSVASAPAASAYAVSANFVRRSAERREVLADGARVKPGDRLTLELQTSQRVWAYVLNEDDQGERWLLFPQPLFDQANPLSADSLTLLPGTVGGRENAWTVTSRGGHERFMVVVSPQPVAELEAELARLPAPSAGRPIEYASVTEGALERLRGVGGVAALTARERLAPAAAGTFDRFRALAGRESDVHGVWVRQLVLENPR